jgi:hypothetical protein
MANEKRSPHTTIVVEHSTPTQEEHILPIALSDADLDSPPAANEKYKKDQPYFTPLKNLETNPKNTVVFLDRPASKFGGTL